MKKLWTSTFTGETSTSKLWRHVAFAVATWVVIKKVDTINYDLFGMYLIIVSGTELGQAWLASRMQTPANKIGTQVNINKPREVGDKECE